MSIAEVQNTKDKDTLTHPPPKVNESVVYDCRFLCLGQFNI